MLETINYQKSDTFKNSYDEFFYGHGKILLTGEYFLLSGAEGLALPVTVGQSLGVKYRYSYDPVLHWRSFDCHGNVWFDEKYEFWHFDSLKQEEDLSREGKVLQQILREARKQNKHFLRDDRDVFVDTVIRFPLDWGLGSSSTLIYNIAQWAYIGPFELLFNTFGGSGYDIACAQSDGPILYKNSKDGPSWSLIDFDPTFKDNIFFLHLNSKQSTAQAIELYNGKKDIISAEKVATITKISQEMMRTNMLEEFDSLINVHESIVAETFGFQKIKERLFPDFWGEIKSLGAWGGDFVMVTSRRDYALTKEYFVSNGYPTLLPYSELVLNSGRESVFKH